jgi:serine/threonine-protein kinase
VKVFQRIAKMVGVGLGLILLSILSGYVAMNLALERGKIEVPVVIGLELKEAARQLREVGLQPRLAAEEYHGNFPKGTVIRQRPAGGSRIRRNAEVRLAISRGSDETLAPDLVGGPLMRAQRILAEQGMLVGKIAKVHTSLPVGEVIAQDPPPGFPARRGGAVNLLVSLGEEERFYLMPNVVGQKVAEALTLLKGMGLDPKVTYESLPDFVGRVVLQDPSFGTRIKEKEQVTLVVAR